MHRTFLAALAAALACAVATDAAAHVVVSPSEATAGSSVTFEMRVPTEGSVPTKQIRGLGLNMELHKKAATL